MQKRIRALTYAEALEAKKHSEENETEIIEQEEKIEQTVTTLNKIEVTDLPSSGKLYDKSSRVYFSPLTFGEMKYLSGSVMGDIESIDFFLDKIQTSFDKKSLTYYDFYYITILIKMSSFGEINYTLNFECDSCGSVNRQPFSTNDLEFEEIKIPLPVKIDLKEPYRTSEDVEITQVSFSPMTIGRYLEMLKNGSVHNEDIFISNMIENLPRIDREKLIKEVLVGPDVKLLETLDVYFFHGVKDIHMKCKSKIKPEDLTEEEFQKQIDKGEFVGEVCGRLHDIPFLGISEYINTTDELKTSLGERIHFGL